MRAKEGRRPTPGLLAELSMCVRWRQREGRTPQGGLVLGRGKMSSSVLFTPAGVEVQGRPPKESHGEIKRVRTAKQGRWEETQ